MGGTGDTAMHETLSCGKLKENANLEDLGIDGRILLEWILKMWDGLTCTNLILFRTATGGGLLYIR
jgi:hypothetical protein